jgi:hypothetical protein
VLLPLADGDHTQPSHSYSTEQCATHAPQYAANLRHPWDQQNGQRQGIAPHELCLLCLWAPVASELALEVEVGVAAAAPAALLLRSNQSLGLLGSASGTFAKWSSGVAVATAAELPPPGVPAAPAEHALHLCACSQSSVESTHTSYPTLQSFSIRKDIWKSS